MAAHAALSLPRTHQPASRPAMPADLPQLRPLGFAHKGKFASTLERVQASTSSVQFVRPDVPPTEEAPAKQRPLYTASSQPRAQGRSALEQAAFVTNAKLQAVRSKASALPAIPSFKLGFFGL